MGFCEPAIITALLCCSALIGGVGIGYVIRDGQADNNHIIVTTKQNKEVDRLRAHAGIIDDLTKENISESLRFLSKEPHVAGSARNNELADHFVREWTDAGLEDVVKKKYHILLSFPRKPAQVMLYGENDVLLQNHTVLETAISDEEKLYFNKTIFPFNGFAPAGDVTAEVLFVNYGRYDDFKALEAMGYNLTGKILIAKYGVTSRSQKLRRAGIFNVGGLLIYSDPSDYSTTGTYYPDSWQLPPTGIQRGTVMTRQGDALSREYPSKDGYFRRNVSDVDYLPKVPCQPITFAQAYTIMRELTDVPVPDAGWQGEFNFTYGVASNTSRKVRMIVDNELESKATYAVQASIRGNIEPDRLIILGNHRDAWTFGTGDATSGSAALLEIGKSLGRKRKEGWRPRRTIMLCSWDAEEYGVMGSVEWVEEHSKMLRTQAVAYLNVDIAVEGNYTIRYKGMPQLDEALFHVTKQMKAPDNDRTLYDDWVAKTPDSMNASEPKRSMMNSGSDYKPFMQTIGIPCVDLRYFFDRNVYKERMYPTYHTLHDNFGWMQKFVDPDFLYHTTLAKMWFGLALYLSDTTLIKFGLKRYADRTMSYVDKFERDYQFMLDRKGLSFDSVRRAVERLQNATEKFENSLANIDLDDPLAVRIANDKLTYFERSFIHHHGLPSFADKMYGHVIMTNTAAVMKSGNRFNGVCAALTQIHRNEHQNWAMVQTEITLVVHHIEMATASLV